MILPLSLFLFIASICCCFADSPKPQTSKVLLKTNQGDVTIQLYPEKAPKTVDNFLQYVRDGFYKNTIFHRVIPDFMIQGGGFEANLKQKETRSPIKNEANNGLSNKRGTIAMARTGVVDSATAQFFINVKDNTFLDHRAPTPADYGYAVFGEVVDGMDVVDKIRNVNTETRDIYHNVPKEPIIILEAIEVKSTP